MSKLRRSPGPVIECAVCGDRIQSLHRHDFQRCTCGETFVDGGSAYLRCGGKPVFDGDRIKTFSTESTGSEETWRDRIRRNPRPTRSEYDILADKAARPAEESTGSEGPR